MEAILNLKNKSFILLLLLPLLISGRYYDPSQGRFIQKDPIGLNGKDTNLYRYVRNNPTKFKDPRGLSAEDIKRLQSSFNKSVEVMNNASLRREGSGTLNGMLNNFLSSVNCVSGGGSLLWILGMRRASWICSGAV